MARRHKTFTKDEPVEARSEPAPPTEPREPWVAIDIFAVQTASILVASSVAAKLRKRRGLRTRQRGVVDGVRWMCLARFHDERAARAKGGSRG